MILYIIWDDFFFVLMNLDYSFIVCFIFFYWGFELESILFGNSSSDVFLKLILLLLFSGLFGRFKVFFC